MRYPSVEECFKLHRLLIEKSGGCEGILDINTLKSALAQPKIKNFAGNALYPTLIEKAAAMAYSFVHNRPFVDGNKRFSHAITEVFLVLNDYEIEAELEEQREVFLSLASHEMLYDEFVAWLKEHVVTF
ncbi:MAG: type II toxin-antitoxin system death-on-curing family toxin [Candidatus Parabeggiatoa sp. nov. 1]|nr:MAG: type II toxin-antitoxin system death-on-curing family toxin [Gammaproteobacteria bacterium]